MHVKELMTASPSACHIDDSANEAARVMWERDCGAVPVLDNEGHVRGIVTDRDICIAAYFQGVPLSAISVAKIMSRDPRTCAPADDLKQAERMMQQHQIRRLPVVSNGGSLVGILSLSDIARSVGPDGQSRQKTAGIETSPQELVQTLAAVSEPRQNTRA